MTDYFYCECPECEFSLVIEGNDPKVGKINCPLCLEDCGHYTKMTERPARDADQPEGYDARKGKV